MNKKQLFTFGTIAALSACNPWVARLHAADVEVKGHADLPKTETTDRDTANRPGFHADVNANGNANADLNASTTENQTQKAIRRDDKASGIIGMEVRNPDNQKLGEIKDMVMDLNSGKVDYAVLAVGGFLGIGEKLIALPPSALKKSDNGDYLVLNADKSQIQAAPGFAATSWPSKHDPAVHQFWNQVRGTGAPAGAESENSVNVNTGHHHGEVNVNTDRNHKIYTDSDNDNTHTKAKVDVNKKD